MLRLNRDNIFLRPFMLLAFLYVFFGIYAVEAGQQWIQDDEMNFKIRVPSDYQKTRMVEGTDVIHAFLSPDQNVALRIRSFKVDQNATIESVAKAFEQNVIAGAQKLLDDKYKLNHIPGKICGYKWTFNNTPVGLATFFAIKNNIAYIVWSIVPEQIFKQRTPETDAIINTFTIISPKKVAKKDTKKVAKKDVKKFPAVKTDARTFDLVSDDSGISHKVPAGFKIFEKEEGQSIWKNDAGIKMVIQTVVTQGDLQNYINSLVDDINGNGATVISKVFTVENGLVVANYAYQHGDTYFAYGATLGNKVYYLVGFVGKTKDKAILTSYSEEANMSLKKVK